MVAATLLLLGGALKAIDPVDTVGALRAAGLPAAPWIVRLGAAAEASIGAYALIAGDRRSALLVLLSYLLFAGFVGWALLRGTPLASCGCFGREDTPPSALHVVLNMACAAAAVAVVVDPGVGLSAVVSSQPLVGLPYLLLVAVGVYAGFLSLTTLPRTLALARVSRAQ